MVSAAFAPSAQRPMPWMPENPQSEQPSESSHMPISPGMVVDGGAAVGVLAACGPAACVTQTESEAIRPAARVDARRARENNLVDHPPNEGGRRGNYGRAG